MEGLGRIAVLDYIPEALRLREGRREE